MTSLSFHLMNDESTLRLIGAIEFTNVEAMYQNGKKWINNAKALLLTIDLGNVTRCDSAGLAMLIAWLAEAKIHGRTIQHVNPSQQITNIINLIGLDKILSVALEN